MSSALAPAQGIGSRSLRNILRLPSAAIPALVMPVFQVIAFTGTYAGITDIPTFPTDRSANWFLPLATVMGCSFAGMSFGLATIRDLQTGFYDRLRMAPVPRRALLFGALLSAVARASMSFVVVTIVGIALGARFSDAIGVVTLLTAGLGIASIGVFWALGLAYRFRDMRAAAIMQLTLFFGLFLTEAQMPRSLMSGWLVTVARYNPLNELLRLSRVGLVEDPSWSAIWPGLVTIASLLVVTGAFARRGLVLLSRS